MKKIKINVTGFFFRGRKKSPLSGLLLLLQGLLGATECIQCAYNIIILRSTHTHRRRDDDCSAMRVGGCLMSAGPEKPENDAVLTHFVFDHAAYNDIMHIKGHWLYAIRFLLIHATLFVVALLYSIPSGPVIEIKLLVIYRGYVFCIV